MADFKDSGGVMTDETDHARTTTAATTTNYTTTTGRAKPHNHDPRVSFYEYKYYAEITRAEQDAGNVPITGNGEHGILPNSMGTPASNEKTSDGEGSKEALPAHNPHVISDDEWMTASRAVRTATWLSVFYLITTDILGPYGVPFAIGTLGWGPGVILYTVFGVLAAFGGWLLWRMFLGLDSHEYPCQTYGDLAFRTYGMPMRHMVNILQSIQLVFNVGIIVIGNGQALSQIAQFRLCYAVCCVLWAFCGFVVGQVRTLQKYGWLANAAIWLNVLVIIFTMGVVAHSEVNYNATGGSAGVALGGASVTPDANSVYPPIQTYAGLPPSDVGFTGYIVGLMQAVYAYGGAMLFIEFMAEMRRPRDFWKAMIWAQLFIYVCYIFFGAFVYGYQGQYAVNPAYQGVSPYAWQTVGNVLAVISGLIAAGLYGNIGIKVLYNNLFVEFLNAPPLTSRGGKLWWIAMVPIYWTIAFIISASIPNFFALSALIAALCIMQFSYTFPPMLHLAYSVKMGALLPGEGFDPATGQVVLHDRGVKRIVRGFFAGGLASYRPWMNMFNIIFMLGSGVTAGLGAYSAIEALIAAFKNPSITAFTCTSPLAPVS